MAHFLKLSLGVLAGCFAALGAASADTVTLRVQEVFENPAEVVDAGGERAAVLAHQSGADMHSWTPFAALLAKHGVTSISLSSSTPHDVLAAIDWLEGRGYREIDLVGASMGGSAIAYAMDLKVPDSVGNIVLLSPAKGAHLLAPTVPKLVLVAKKDFWASRAYDTYETAGDPKKLVEYDGTEHGQGMLAGPQGDRVAKDILLFMGIGGNSE